MTIPSINPKSSIALLPNDVLGIVFACVGERGAIPKVCIQWERVFNSPDTTYPILWAMNNNSTVSDLLSIEFKKSLQGSERFSSTALRNEIQWVYQQIILRTQFESLRIYPPQVVEYARNQLKGDPEIALALNFEKFRSEFRRNYKHYPRVYNPYNNSWRVYADKQREFLQPMEYVLNDQKFWIYVVSRNPDFLSLASDDIRNNEKVVLAAVTVFQRPLQYASDRLKNDPKIWMQIVSCDPNFLQYANPLLKDDPDIVASAIRKDPGALHYASHRLQKLFSNQKVR